ncbi:carbohydrate ABC transporter permease, partial [Mesorhizobium sp. M7A.F.Ca.CA.002.10.1.1]
MSAVTTPARQASGGVNVKTLNRIVIYGLLALFALFYLMPLFVMLVT